jgi:hypothetical protein
MTDTLPTAAYRAVTDAGRDNPGVPSLSVLVPATLVAGVVLLLAGWLMLRLSGARASMARRLAGAREVKVGALLDIGPGDPLPPRPVRVVGRIRCGDPLVTGDDERLVAFQRDVAVQLPGGAWRTIERLRESRTFDLWDHDGSLRIDPSDAAEPLVSIPHVWEGPAAELGDAYAAAVERLEAEGGAAPQRARSETRMVSVVERLLVLAEVRRDAAGGLRLAPPPGGFVISTLELDEAMRLLGGRRPRLLLAAMGATALGIVSLAAGLILLLLSLVVGA